MKVFIVFLCSLFVLQGFIGLQAQESKKVIIIGCSSGIGKELARTFVRNGYVVGGVSRNEEKLAVLQEELQESFCYKVADVTTEESSDAVEDLIQKMDGCDIFVINAGIWSDGRPFDVVNLSFENFDWQQLFSDQKSVIATNVTGFVRMGTIALKHFTQQKKGHLVGISSVDAVRGNPWASVYSASKTFESQYMQAWRSLFEMGCYDIQVTDIRPGFVQTYPISEGAFWVETVEVAAQDIYTAILAKEKVAYITKRWEKFAQYLMTVPDTIYNFLASNFGIKGFFEETFLSLGNL